MSGVEPRASRSQEGQREDPPNPEQTGEASSQGVEPALGRGEVGRTRPVSKSILSVLRCPAGTSRARWGSDVLGSCWGVGATALGWGTLWGLLVLVTAERQGAGEGAGGSQGLRCPRGLGGIRLGVGTRESLGAAALAPRGETGALLLCPACFPGHRWGAASKRGHTGSWPPEPRMGVPRGGVEGPHPAGCCDRGERP